MNSNAYSVAATEKPFQRRSMSMSTSTLWRTDGRTDERDRGTCRTVSAALPPWRPGAPSEPATLQWQATASLLHSRATRRFSFAKRTHRWIRPALGTGQDNVIRTRRNGEHRLWMSGRSLLRRHIPHDRLQFQEFFEPSLTPFSAVARLFEAPKTTSEVDPRAIDMNVAGANAPGDPACPLQT